MEMKTHSFAIGQGSYTNYKRLSTIVYNGIIQLLYRINVLSKMTSNKNRF